MNDRTDTHRTEQKPAYPMNFEDFRRIFSRWQHPKEPLSEAEGRVWRSGADKPREQIPEIKSLMG